MHNSTIKGCPNYISTTKTTQLKKTYNHGCHISIRHIASHFVMVTSSRAQNRHIGGGDHLPRSKVSTDGEQLTCR